MLHVPFDDFNYYIITINKYLELRIPDNCTRYYISDITPYFFDLAANIKYAEKLVLHKFVRNITVEKARKILNDQNYNENKKLESLFQIGFEFAGHVLNNYWFLKPNIELKVKNFIKKNFLGNFIIGMQIRFDFLNQKDINRFINCALKIERKNKNLNRLIKWFILSDNNNTIQSLINSHGGKILVNEGKIGHIAFEANTYERAILDIELLSYCNEIILTGGSTFGFISALKSQKRPYFVEGRRSKNTCKFLDFYAPARSPYGYSSFK